jgi:hypothetical protein
MYVAILHPLNQIESLLTTLRPGFRTSHPLPPRTARRALTSPAQHLHHSRHCSPMGSQHLSNLEHDDTRSDSLPSYHLRPIRGSLGLRHRMLGRMEYVEARKRSSRRARDGDERVDVQLLRSSLCTHSQTPTMLICKYYKPYTQKEKY